MNTLLLQYALEVNKVKSITKAASNLYMQQPNLSKAIKELEDYVGYQIFERTQKGMLPTTKGVAFLAYAREIMDKIDALEALSADRDEEARTFKISIPRGSYIANGFTEFVAELDLTQNINLTICETNSLHTIDQVVDEKFNLGIIRYQKSYENYFLDYLKNKNVRCEDIWNFNYLAVMSRNHPLAEAESITMEELGQYTEICHGDTEIPYLDIRDMWGEKRDTVSSKIYVYERESQFEMLTNVKGTYMWVSPIPKRYLEQFGLTQRAFCVSQNQYKDVLIYRDGYRFTELDKKFQSKLYASKIEVASETYR